MSFSQWQQPAVAVACGIGRIAFNAPRIALLAIRPATTPISFDITGRRAASVKAQGQYKLKPKRTIPKKLGAKRATGEYVIPGNIIWKQRGTIWWPGENCMMGRDHTIHATAPGYVQFYRDPVRHPDRKYIGVTFNRNDTLPYPKNAPRKRHLGMVSAPVLKYEERPDISPSGIPYEVEQVAAFRRNPKKPRANPRILRLRDDYSYREDNWRIGQLSKKPERTWGYGRKTGFKNSRAKRVREIEAARKGMVRKQKKRALERNERRAKRKAERAEVAAATAGQTPI